MPPVLAPLPDDALAPTFRLTLPFALALLLPLVAVFGWLGLMEGYIEAPLPPGLLDRLGPPVAILALASLGIAPLATMITVVAAQKLERELARYGDPAAVRRAVVEDLRRDLRERAGPPLRTLLGVSPEAWAAADGELHLALEPSPFAAMPFPAAHAGPAEQAPTDIWLVVSTRRGRPKVNVVWRVRRDDGGRWRVVGQSSVADFMRERLSALAPPPSANS